MGDRLQPKSADTDLWAGERPLVGNYGLRRTLIDIMDEWGIPGNIADTITCHAPATKVQYGGHSHRRAGTRQRVYLNSADRVVLVQAAEVLERLRTRPYVPTRLSFVEL